MYFFLVLVQIAAGDELESDRYLIQVEEEKVSSVGDVANTRGPRAGQPSMGCGAITSRPLTNTSAYNRQGQLLGSTTFPGPRSLGGQGAAISSSCHQGPSRPPGLRVGLKRKSSLHVSQVIAHE